MSIVTQLAAAAQPWADLYSNSTTLQAIVMFTHLAGVLLSGGAAVTTDRATIAAARREPLERARQLVTLRASHRMILVGLGVTVASGVLLLGGDVETLLVAPAFWVKMGLLALLLANGVLITRAERAPVAVHVGGAPVAAYAGHASGDAEADASAVVWGRLSMLSYVSLSLWFALLLASTFLVSAA